MTGLPDSIPRAPRPAHGTSARAQRPPAEALEHLELSACEYLASRDIALTIGDTFANDAQPSGEGGADFAVPNPLQRSRCPAGCVILGRSGARRQPEQGSTESHRNASRANLALADRHP